MAKSLLSIFLLINLYVCGQTLTFNSMRTFMSSEDAMGSLREEKGSIKIDTQNNKITIVFTSQTVIYKILSFQKEGEVVTYNCERPHPGSGNVYNFTMVYDPFYMSFKLIPIFDGVFSTYTVYNLVD